MPRRIGHSRDLSLRLLTSKNEFLVESPEGLNIDSPDEIREMAS